MSKILNKIATGCAFRADWQLMGVRFLRSSGFRPRHVKVAGQTIAPKDLEGSNIEEIIEALGVILTEDEYGLKRFSENPPLTIIDVGGNIGLFSMVARARFPDAKIHCYEPSPDLIPILKSNLNKLNVKLSNEGLDSRQQRVRMIDRGPSGAWMTEADDTGNITTIPLRDAVKKIGGSVDLIKLDCEGAEWNIFRDTEGWKGVRNLVMEYHLWAGDRSLHDLIDCVQHLGFHIARLEEHQNNFNGILWATKSVSEH